MKARVGDGDPRRPSLVRSLHRRDRRKSAAPAAAPRKSNTEPQETAPQPPTSVEAPETTRSTPRPTGTARRRPVRRRKRRALIAPRAPSEWGPLRRTGGGGRSETAPFSPSASPSCGHSGGRRVPENWRTPGGSTDTRIFLCQRHWKTSPELHRLL